MVKLVSGRECRTYGPRESSWRRSAEYMNAGLYLFSALLLLVSYIAQLFNQTKFGLILLLISFSLIILINLHDLFAHLAGIHFRLRLMGFDPQLALVEFAVPFLQAAATLLSFFGIIFLLIQKKRVDDGYLNWEKHAMGMLIAGPVLWVIGSIINSCQIYESADSCHLQLLQHSVEIPFLIGSCMFLVGSILNSSHGTDDGIDQYIRHGIHLLEGSYWRWFGMWGSLLWLMGGLNNVMKVVKMDGMRLEKLRGGAQERLLVHAYGGNGRDAVLLMADGEEQGSSDQDVTSTYKDALIGHMT